MEVVCIGSTSATAVELREALPALLLGIYVGALEFISDISPYYSLVDIAHKEILISYELMTGIKVTPGSYRKIFRSRTTARQSLGDTGASRKVYHKMEEINRFSRLGSSYNIPGKLIIFLKNLRNILFP